MKKIRLTELSDAVRSFLDQVRTGESIMVVDENDQLQCGITPYYRASERERAEAWERLEVLQERVGRRMAKKGITEDDIDRVLQEDD